MSFVGEEAEGDVSCSFAKVFPVFEGGMRCVRVWETNIGFGGETGVRHRFVYGGIVIFCRSCGFGGAVLDCCWRRGEIYLGGGLVEWLVWVKDFEGVLFAVAGAVDKVVETDFAVLFLALVAPQRSSLLRPISL